MPYSVRELPADEWEKLRTLPFGTHRLPDPALCAVLVVENEAGEIVACWSAQTAVHLEGLWAREDSRGNPVVSRLLFQGMKGMLVDKGIPFSFTIVTDLDVLALAARHGFQRIQGDLLLLDLERMG